jgi:cell volume regulation protein A
VAVTAWGLFDFTTRQALLVGAALAPTDPAVVFSLLGKRKLPGRASTLLEGESGANDPIGIALMITVLDAHWHGASTVLDGAGKFALELGVGAAFGLLGGLALLYGIRHIRVPWWVAASLTLPIALGLYWVCAVAHGSGFLGVFVAGIVIGDEHKERITRITGRVSSLAEIVAFVVLGLSVEFADIWHHGHIPAGAGLAAVLVLLVRPLLVGLVLWPVRLGRAERVFVLWAGFKGAVPILLGTLILEHGVAGGQRIYDVVFVVVLLSVIVQGMLLPLFTRRLPEADDLS